VSDLRNARRPACPDRPCASLVVGEAGPVCSALLGAETVREDRQEEFMPETPTAVEEVIASCSFCGKSNTDVTTLVAGPGVFICNECVDLSLTIVVATADITSEDRARLRAEALDRPIHDILDMLPGLMESAKRAEYELARWIDRLRGKGTDWNQIADALGVGVAEVRRRFDATTLP
jgi:hypothetical protein